MFNVLDDVNCLAKDMEELAETFLPTSAIENSMSAEELNIFW